MTDWPAWLSTDELVAKMIWVLFGSPDDWELAAAAEVAEGGRTTSAVADGIAGLIRA